MCVNTLHKGDSSDDDDDNNNNNKLKAFKVVGVQTFGYRDRQHTNTLAES
jgi:hypothetical protein